MSHNGRVSKLNEYQKKRSSGKSPEPTGNPSKRSEGKLPLFVIQEHDASNLHFDFRLEAGGVLKSWAVPKGLSTDPRVKRLAIETEDHPLDYADFEGVIPEGEYGAGGVIVWDQGTYDHRTQKDGEEIGFEQAVAKGHISVFLHGEKLQGGYEIIKLEGKNYSKGQWLIKKTDDAEADARRRPVNTQPESVISGHTVKEIQEQE